MGLNKLAAFSCMSLTLACTGAAMADSFSTGQIVSYSENDWGSGIVASSLLTANYNSVFASTNDILVVGVPGISNQYFMSFANASDVREYLPATGNPGPLTASLVNPTISPSGQFGGDVTALALNIDFSNAGLLGGTSSVPFGDLLLTNFTGSLSNQELNGLTVDQFLAIANICLSGGSCPYGVLDVASITDSLNLSFEAGTPSAWAQTYLELPSSGTPTPTPEPSGFLLSALGLLGLRFLFHRRGITRGPPAEH
jgi:hypothetical protein